jgi:hypothetical protein
MHYRSGKSNVYIIQQLLQLQYRHQNLLCSSAFITYEEDARSQIEK